MFSKLLSVCFVAFAVGRQVALDQDPLLRGANRVDRDGWIELQLAGDAYTVGYQHGSLIASEFAEAWEAYDYMMYQTTGKTLAVNHQLIVVLQ